MPDQLSSLLDQPTLPAIGPLRISYDTTPLAKLLGERQVLANIEFDSEPHNSADARLITYGPVSPGFARAMRAPRDLLSISGTATIVGHESQSENDLAAQADEMLENLRSLNTASRQHNSTKSDGALLLKAYERGSGDVAFVTERLRDALPETGQSNRARRAGLSPRVGCENRGCAGLANRKRTQRPRHSPFRALLSRKDCKGLLSRPKIVHRHSCLRRNDE